MSYIKSPVQIITRRMFSPGNDIAIDYPFVFGLENPSAQQKINNDILSMVKGIIAEQYKKLADQGYEQPVVTMQGWYEIKTNERDVLSLTLGNYTFPYPAAHGLTILNSLTFDITTGKSYTLGEMFKPGSNYVKTLSNIIRIQIKERKIELLGEFKGISPDQYYYIADKCIVIYFQLYDITPYAFGFPFFPISVYEIQDMLKENSPLERMAASG